MPHSLINDPSVTLDAVDREIASGFRRLVFAPPIERAFQRGWMAQRIDLFGESALVACALYDVFLIIDWIALHDMFGFMAVARLGIFTPMTLICIAIARRARTAAHLNAIGVFAPAIAVLLPMAALIFSESQERMSYQYGSLLVMLFTTVVQRLHFRYAVFALTVMLCEQSGAVYLSDAFDADTRLQIVTFFVTACALLATTSYYIEYTERRSCLFQLRASLLHARLDALARTDALTDLFNRRHLDTVSAKIEADATPRHVSAILLDIDHFKAFNDSQGHVAGDDCLRRISACIVRAVEGAGGLAFRFGGEEMVVLLDGVDHRGAYAVAEAIRTEIGGAAIPHPALGVEAVVTVSLGIAAGPVPDVRVADLIAAADTALYAAKHAGRDRVWPQQWMPCAPRSPRIAA